ncbi:MAG: hypothetical protein ABSF44_09510 [Candidatus Bathyarchaeia archaeon]|jgi:hypothetical protein
MIKIKQTRDGSPLITASVSDFCASMGYCEVSITHFLKGIKPPETQIIIDGTKSHEKEEVLEKEHFTFKPVTIEELEDFTRDIEFAREGLYTRFQRELSFGNEKLSLLLLGRADKVLRSKGTLIVEDSKYPANKEKYQDTFEPYDTQKLQTLLYLNSRFSESFPFSPKVCFDIPCEKKAWIINIKDKATMESLRVFQGVQTEEAENFLKEKINRFALLALGKFAPFHHCNIKKCKSCRFEECENKIS